MENDLVFAKIESLNRCVARLEEKKPNTADILRENIDLQDIISVNLERAIQICVDIGSHILADYTESAPMTMSDTFRAMTREGLITEPLAKNLTSAVGFRNISVHEYEKIDWDIVFSILVKHLKDFKEFARCVYEKINIAE